MRQSAHAGLPSAAPALENPPRTGSVWYRPPRVSRSWNSRKCPAQCSFMTVRAVSFTPNVRARHGDGSCKHSAVVGSAALRVGSVLIARALRWIQRPALGAFCGRWFRRRARVASDAGACCPSGLTAGRMETVVIAIPAGEGAMWNACGCGAARGSRIRNA